MPNSYKRLLTNAKTRKSRKRLRNSRLANLERLEDRNLLAGDLGFEPALVAEGEGGEPVTLLHRESQIFNDGISVAEQVPLGIDAGESTRVEVNGFFSNLGDLDVYRADLRGGDVLQLNLFGDGQTISVFDAAGNELITSSFDANSLSQQIDTGEVSLPEGGNASLGRVLSTDGTYYVQVAGASGLPGGAYTLQMRVDRPALEMTPVGTHQILFLDFDGAVLSTDIFGAAGAASLSPLASFLPSWGLTAGDESAVIDAIVASVEEDLSTEIRQFGINGDYLATGIPGQFDIEIRNSRDHADPFGQPHVSRIIIGGTQGELGVPTIGISEGLDVGNLDTTESAVVLLDVLSGQTTPQSPINLNNVAVAANSTRIDLIGAAVGGIASHEAGHFFGLFHTDLGNNVLNLIDQGGDILQVIGAGPDGIFGSADDLNTGFINPDNYTPNEGFTGIQDTLNALSWSLSTGRLPSSVTGVKFHDINKNGIRDLTEPGLEGWTIYSDLDGDGMLGLREPKTVSDADGNYTLSVPPGQHVVREVLQPGWEQTFPTNGSHTVVVQANSTVPNINFGNVSLLGGISGTKFNDLDGDGTFDVDEPAVPGITIYLDLDGDNRLDLGEPQAVTDSDGNYSITITETGTFTVREALTPGWEQTFPRNTEREHVVTASPGQSFPGLNFGNTSQLDYGDAPTAEQSGFASSYPTTIADNGAVHAILPGFHIGAPATQTVDPVTGEVIRLVDGDPDGTPTLGATGDDGNTTVNDENGVTFTAASIFPGSPAGEMTVEISSGGYSPGRVNAWMDFNRDGDWNDPGEHIVKGVRAGEGSHVYTFPVPADAVSGETYVRVRYGYGRDMLPTGSDVAGEVEDHLVRILSEIPLAVDDQFTVTQGDGATNFAVLLNDQPSLSPPLTVIAAGGTTVGVTAAGGQVSVAASGTGVVYTPPTNFFGDDSFSYTIRDGAGNTDSANVSVTVLPSLVNPLAIDDSFTVQAGSTNNQLAILANDLTGQNPPISIVAVETPSGGTVSIDNRGTANTGDDTLVYTPAQNFTGTDQFTYTVQDQAQVNATATVTVHVDDGNDDRVRIRLQATDLSGNPIQAIGVGEEFNLQVRVADDLRVDDEDGDPAIDRFGVAGAYLDVLYNFNLVSLSTTRNPFFSPDFQNATFISTATPGLIDEAGAFQTDQTNPLGRTCQIEIQGATCQPEDNEFVVLTIPMRATSQGVANFVGDPADRRTNGPLSPPDHDVLLFNPAQPVPIEEVRYENESLTILGSGGLPIAVDNTFRLSANSGANSLDVLANDTEIANPPLTITGTGIAPGASAVQGTVSIAPNGSSILYTPRVGFVGTEQFTYTVTNDVGLSADAVVTVVVGNSPNDINLRLETTDLSNNPISTITAGSEFKVRAYVQDIRTSPPDPTRVGVFALYFDLLYDSGLVTTQNDPANRFGFGINFGPQFNSNGLSANNSFTNIVDEIGAFQNGSTALGGTEFLLAELIYRANTPGVAEFVSDPADLSPFHDVLLFEPPAPVAVDRVGLGVASITIVGVGPEGESPYTNPNNKFDVNNDGNESAIDALIVINHLDRFGATALFSDTRFAGLGEGEDAVVHGYVDVNGDEYVTALDALQIINLLNGRATRGLGEGEASSVVLSSDTSATDSPLAVAPLFISNNASSDSSRIITRSTSGSNSSDPTADAIDTLFYHHSQADSAASANRDDSIDSEADGVSDELLDLLVGSDSETL